MAVNEVHAGVSRRPGRTARTGAAFTLIELLVSVAIIGIAAAIVAPAATTAIESSRAAVCRSGLRQISMICQMYADDSKGVGPAIGAPYDAIPNWALVVESAGGRAGETREDLYHSGSILVCPSIDRAMSEDMTRTYGMNTFGLAYDDPLRPAFVPYRRVVEPHRTVLVADTRQVLVSGPGPGATRTASVLIPNALWTIHVAGGVKAAQGAHVDGSVWIGARVDEISIR